MITGVALGRDLWVQCKVCLMSGVLIYSKIWRKKLGDIVASEVAKFNAVEDTETHLNCTGFPELVITTLPELAKVPCGA